MAESPGLDFGHEWTHALSFRWGADIYASPAAYMAGAAYAKATDGIVLDCEEYRFSRRSGQCLDSRLPAAPADEIGDLGL